MPGTGATGLTDWPNGIQKFAVGEKHWRCRPVPESPHG